MRIATTVLTTTIATSTLAMHVDNNNKLENRDVGDVYTDVKNGVKGAGTKIKDGAEHVKSKAEDTYETAKNKVSTKVHDNSGSGVSISGDRTPLWIAGFSAVYALL